MADQRLTDKTELAETPASGDLIHVVDVSDTTDNANGTSKKVTRANLVGGLASSGANSDITSLTGLTTDLAVTHGGTGASTAADARTNLGVDAAGTDNSTDVTLAGTPDYITIAGQVITRNQIDLTTDVTGVLPEANLPDASTTAQGVVELATGAETNTGTDATRAVTPDALDDWTGSAQITTVGTLASGDADAIVSAASTTTAGKVEIATAAEVNTGTDAARAVSPDALAGSNFGIRYIQVVGFDFTTDTAVGDGCAYMHIPAAFNGMNLVEVHAEVITAGTTGTTDIQIHNVTDAADMLSTKITIDSAETGSDTAATPAVINTATDDVATNDLLRIDVDAVSTTPAKGLICTLGFQLP